MTSAIVPGQAKAAASPAQAVMERLGEMRSEFVDFVRQLALAESPTTDKEAQAGVRRLLESALREAGLDVEHIPGRRSGGCLVARPPSSGSPPGSSQLIIGHMDTVWPIGALRHMPVQLSGDRLSGPGVLDMKAGLAIGIFAIRALGDLGCVPAVSPVFIINSDEETGSAESEELIVEWAGRAERAFVLEPGLGRRGRLKTRRKGVAQFTVNVTGRSSHAGLAPEEGASAIHEMTNVIRRVTALADAGRGVTTNVGIVQGGSRSNVVAGHATAVIDVRSWNRTDVREVGEALRGIEPTIPGTSIEVVEDKNRSALERTARNARLFEEARQVGEQIGLRLEEGSAGGGSDGNITSMHTATLDGLGAVGDGAHATHEFISVDHTVARIALLAGLLARPSGLATRL